MREYELIIDEALKKGLSPVQHLPFNSQFLWQALGFRCGKAGLEPYHPGSNPIPVAVDMHYNWPFPQFVTGEKFNFLVIRDNILEEDIVYTVSDDNLTVTHVFSVDKLTFGQGWLMDVADFGEYVFMTNGVCMIYWNVGGAWNASKGLIDTPTIPLIGTVCNLKGQLIGGNVRETWYDCDETFYVWSKIGHNDLVPSQGNESGYRRCPYGGEIYHVRRLGDVAIGYSSKGITAIQPVSEPAATLGFTELLGVGLHNRGAVNGSLHRQVFVGEDLSVRELTKEGIKELDYKAWMGQIDAEDIIVSYDKTWEDFYIGNSIKTFLLTKNGLTEVPQHPSAVWRRGSGGVYMLPATVDDNYSPTVTTEAFEMGYRGQKTISTIETDAFPADGPYAAVDYSYDLTTWRSTLFTPINENGIATIPIAANVFRFKLRFDSLGDSFRIGYIKPRYKMTDLRGIRGVYAPPIRGQA